MANFISKGLFKKNTGFTLLEMVIVIIIIGILSVTVLPKFFNSSGFEEHTYRAEVISVLRAIQLRAMQNTDGSCYQVLIKAKQLGRPDIGVCNGNSPPSPPSFSGSWNSNSDSNTSVVVSHNDVSFLVGGFGLYFEFDDLGRFTNCNCSGPYIDIVIKGESNLKVRIEQEGYIHAI